MLKRRNFNKKKRFPGVKTFLKIFITLFLLTLIIYFLFNFKTRKVLCKSQFGYCNEVVAGLLIPYENKSLFVSYINLSKALEKNILVDDFTIQVQFPGNLLVGVVENTPLYSLCSEDCTKYFLVDKNGVIISSSNTKFLPVVKFDNQSFVVGQSLDDKVIKALRIAKGVLKYLEVSNFYSDKESLFVDFATGLQVIFPLDGDEKVLLGSMYYILGELNRGGENSIIDNISLVKTIDLRYKNPVIVKK
jgi:cell division septal protein FtsQ